VSRFKLVTTPTLAVAAALLLPCVTAAQQPEVQLTLDDAVRRALERNLDVQVERLNPQVQDYSISVASSNWVPNFTSSLNTRSQENQPQDILSDASQASITQQNVTTQSGFNQLLRWGGSYQVAWNNGRFTTNNTYSPWLPQLSASFAAGYSQPLLRNFRIDGARQQYLVSKKNREISDVQLTETVAQTGRNVRNAYWDLVFVGQAVEVARRSLELAAKLIEDNKLRVEAGALAPIDVVEAEAEAASRRQALAQIEATALTAELALKRLIVEGTSDPLWRSKLVPVDRPVFRPEPIDVEAAVARAIAERTDIEQARHELDVTDVNLRYFRNQALPAVDAVASYGLQGLGGTQFIRQGSGLGSVITGTVPGGYRDALAAIGRRSFPTWNVALNITMPVFGNAFEAQRARAQVQRTQTQTEIKALELRIATEVTNAALQIQSNLKRVEAATAARALAERRLEAEQSKFEVGLSTNFFVVQAQRDLQDAQNVELRALLDYQKSIVDFERAQETSLQRAGVTLQTGGGQ